MKRREFISLLSAAAWPLAARAQQPAMPVIGFLSSGSPDSVAGQLAGFRKGLADLGYVEGRNISIEYRWVEQRYERLPEMAADLVRRPVAALFANTPPGARAALAATSTIPIVFSMGEDPIKEGLVTSFNRPNGNIIGVTSLTNQLFVKRLQLLHEIVPKTRRLPSLSIQVTRMPIQTQKKLRRLRSRWGTSCTFFQLTGTAGLKRSSRT